MAYFPGSFPCNSDWSQNVTVECTVIGNLVSKLPFPHFNNSFLLRNFSRWSFVYTVKYIRGVASTPVLYFQLILAFPKGLLTSRSSLPEVPKQGALNGIKGSTKTLRLFAKCCSICVYAPPPRFFSGKKIARFSRKSITHKRLKGLP